MNLRTEKKTLTELIEEAKHFHGKLLVDLDCDGKGSIKAVIIGFHPNKQLDRSLVER